VPYLVLTGKGERTRETGGLPPGTQVFPDLAAMVSALLKGPGPTAHA
jgi:D-glycero-D-manno-heptose 1,7-bisphosphate phosphatase